jgi:peptidoglycan/LPS O-acetylase OafA/YrhL
MSKISYSVYLTNWLFIQLTDHYLVAVNGWLKILFVLGSTITVSFFQYKYFEKPLIDLRDKFAPPQKDINIFPKKGSLAS